MIVIVATCVATVATAQRSAPNSPQPRRELAPLPGVRLWFTDTGGSGEPIVLMHANTGTSEIWEPQVEAFSKAGYRVITFDRRGWGRSQADAATGLNRDTRRTISMRSPTFFRSPGFIS